MGFRLFEIKNLLNRGFDVWEKIKTTNWQHNKTHLLNYNVRYGGNEKRGTQMMPSTKCSIVSIISFQLFYWLYISRLKLAVCLWLRPHHNNVIIVNIKILSIYQFPVTHFFSFIISFDSIEMHWPYFALFAFVFFFFSAIFSYSWILCVPILSMSLFVLCLAFPSSFLVILSLSLSISDVHDPLIIIIIIWLWVWIKSFGLRVREKRMTVKTEIDRYLSFSILYLIRKAHKLNAIK